MPGGIPGSSPEGVPDGAADGAPDGGTDGSTDGTASTGSPSGGASAGGGASGAPGATSGGGNGPLTPAEQVAVLDAELESGTGDFDTMILDTQEEQREERRGEPGLPPSAGGGQGSGGGDGDSVATHTPEVFNIPDGASGSGNTAPQNTAKFPPPADIPSGNDDDVVARQLRELAMSEPDPAVRERLWEEYRKYKGIN